MIALLHMLVLLAWCSSALGSINFILLGDWGADPYMNESLYGDPDVTPSAVFDQHLVRDKMDLWSSRYGCDYIVTSGDNFYPTGVTSMNDSRWDDVWRNVYNTSNLKGLVWYATLGNHDHFGDPWAEINMTYEDPSWYMPFFYYDFYQVKDGVKIHHITIDTELVYVASLLEEQLIWLNETLENAEPSDWTIVAAHFPIRSCGHYAPGVFLAKVAFLPILEHYGVDFYLNGHDHNLQHIIKNDTTPPEFVISGAGGKSISGFGIKPLRCIEMHNQGYTLDFFGQRFGFTTFVAEKESITITFYSHAGEEDDLQELYSFTTVKDADYWSDV